MNTIGSRTTRTEAYPLPYSEFCLPIVSGKGYIGVLNYGFGIGVTNFGLTSVTIANNSEDSSYRWTGYTYIVVGAQPQWGKILGDTVNLKIINFPVSFNECFGGLALFNGDPVAAAEYATITDITNTNFKIYMYANNAGTGYTNANIFYLFLGAQQQWGFTVFDPAYYKNVNFTLPLSVNGTFCAFSTGYDAKGSTFLWHSMSHFNNVNVGVTGFVFDSRYTFTGLGYLAVCWQKQWGTSVSPIIFSISFSNTMYTILQMPQSASTSAFRAEVWALERKDQDSCAFFTGSGNYSRHWIAVGF